jgi:hypothetical protein
VDTDDAEMAMLRQMLCQTSLEESPLRLAYDADVNGWTPDAFHAAVNTFGAAIVIAETTGGAVIGGYNPSGWQPCMCNGSVLANTATRNRLKMNMEVV